MKLDIPVEREVIEAVRRYLAATRGVTAEEWLASMLRRIASDMPSSGPPGPGAPTLPARRSRGRSGHGRATSGPTCPRCRAPVRVDKGTASCVVCEWKGKPS